MWNCGFGGSEESRRVGEGLVGFWEVCEFCEPIQLMGMW